MESDEDEPPDLVPISAKKIPVTIITGYLGTYTATKYHKPVKKHNTLCFVSCEVSE